MSVKIGNVIRGDKTYVVGAPRSMEVGQVMLLQTDGEYLLVRLTLTGEQFGSGFGYDIAIGDFNNDRLGVVRFLSLLMLDQCCHLCLTLSPPIRLRLYTLPYWSNPPFLIFDIQALWRSGLSAIAPECQKLTMVR